MTGFDVIVVGAGGAGAPLAARLSEDPERSVLLLEAGPTPNQTNQFPPELLDSGTVQGALPGHPNNWSFRGNLTQDLAYSIARGKILGGSTTVNGGYLIRARRQDFERWSAVSGQFLLAIDNGMHPPLLVLRFQQLSTTGAQRRPAHSDPGASRQRN